MARHHKFTVGEAGFLSRRGELYIGGPPEGVLQKLHPASRFAGAAVILLGVSLATNPIVLVAFFCLAMAVAVLGFLNLRSIYQLLMFPILLLVLPSWLLAAFLYEAPLLSGGVFFLRTLASVSIGSVMLHSIGLRRMGAVFQWMQLPVDIRQMWSIMVSQIAGFTELLTDMSLARSARSVEAPRSAIIRRQVGRQMGILFSRTWQRGNQLAFATEARQLSNCRRSDNCSVDGSGWSYLDVLAFFFCVLVAAGGVAL